MMFLSNNKKNTVSSLRMSLIRWVTLFQVRFVSWGYCSTLDVAIKPNGSSSYDTFNQGIRDVFQVYVSKGLLSWRKYQIIDNQISVSEAILETVRILESMLVDEVRAVYISINKWLLL